MFHLPKVFEQEMMIANISIINNRFHLLMPQFYAYRRTIAIYCNLSANEEQDIADWLRENCISNSTIILEHIYKHKRRTHNIIGIYFQSRKDLLLSKLRFDIVND